MPAMAAFPAGPWRIRGEKALASLKGGKAAIRATEKDHGGNSMAQPEEDACHGSEWPEQLLKKRQPVGKREKNHESPDREDPCFLVERHPSPKKCPHAAPLACCLARHLGLWPHLAACMPLGFARHATVRRGLLHVRAHPRGGPAAKKFRPRKGPESASLSRAKAGAACCAAPPPSHHHSAASAAFSVALGRIALAVSPVSGR
ncbi:hypothetical protein EV686_11266 [Paracandidimonas soli]|uniref:Uncharacterized protein n=1 Tax=Paracandidimonas soli TaxID=1917182 RepID=A0A4R3URH3_9BURK|nr:hypothetical protein EV686_11266 [Paracandidimonas soli]